MIPIDQMQAIATQLLQKSKRDEVRWLGDINVTPPSGLTVRLDSGTIRVGFVEPPIEPDFYYIAIENEDGAEVGTLVASESDSDFPLVSGLYREAVRSLLHWDTTANRILLELQKPEPIGVVPQQRANDPDDPF